jgi:hypothetical protein
MLSRFVFPTLVHRDRHLYGIFTCGDNLYLCIIDTPAFAKPNVLAIKGERTMQALKNPDTDCYVDELFVREFIDMAVKPSTNEKEDDANLVCS